MPKRKSDAEVEERDRQYQENLNRAEDERITRGWASDLYGIMAERLGHLTIAEQMDLVSAFTDKTPWDKVGEPIRRAFMDIVKAYHG